MTEIKINKKLTLQQIKKANFQELLSNDEYLRVMEINNKKYIIKRIGKCKPDSCKSICCKKLCLAYKSDYLSGFGKQIKDATIIEKTCKSLNIKCNTCKKWKSKFPKACKGFPHPEDKLYQYVYNECSFKFEILYEIKK